MYRYVLVSVHCWTLSLHPEYRISFVMCYSYKFTHISTNNYIFYFIFQNKYQFLVAYIVVEIIAFIGIIITIILFIFLSNVAIEQYLESIGYDEQITNDVQPLRISMCVILVFVACEYEWLAMCSFLLILRLLQYFDFVLFFQCFNGTFYRSNILFTHIWN